MGEDFPKRGVVQQTRDRVVPRQVSDATLCFQERMMHISIGCGSDGTGGATPIGGKKLDVFLVAVRDRPEDQQVLATAELDRKRGLLAGAYRLADLQRQLATDELLYTIGKRAFEGGFLTGDGVECGVTKDDRPVRTIDAGDNDWFGRPLDQLFQYFSLQRFHLFQEWSKPRNASIVADALS